MATRDDEMRRGQERAHGEQAAIAVAEPNSRTDRRGMLRAALGIAAAATGAGALLNHEAGAAHADGYNGTFDATGYGTIAVLGTAGNSATGVSGVSTDGIGVYGSSTSNSQSSAGVQGQGYGLATGVIARSDGGDALHAICGGGNKSGVYAEGGSGNGVVATSSGGPGRVAVSGTGTSGTPGVVGTSDSGNGVFAQSTNFDAIHAIGGGGVRSGVYAEGGSGYGVAGTSTGGAGRAAVYGIGISGAAGVQATSDSGYGMAAQGGLAPLYLKPAATVGAASSGMHQMGELYVDSAGALYFCVASGAPGTWKRVSLM